MKHVLLITGRPGVGKTTVIREVAAGLSRWEVGGFYTEEIRTAGARVGFRLTTFDGRHALMAHVDFRGSARIGRYGVDVAAVDELAASALAAREDASVYLVDEIGPMECLSAAFVKAVRARLDSAAPVIATIAHRGGGFIGEVKQRTDTDLLEVTHGNRDELPGRVRSWLGK